MRMAGQPAYAIRAEHGQFGAGLTYSMCGVLGLTAALAAAQIESPHPCSAVWCEAMTICSGDALNVHCQCIA